MINSNKIIDDILNEPRVVRIAKGGVELFDGQNWRPIPLGNCSSNTGIVLTLRHFIDYNWFTTDHVNQLITTIHNQFPELAEG